MARIHSAETGCVCIFQLPQTVSPSFPVQKSNFGWQFGHKMAALFGVVEKCKSSQTKPVPSSANEFLPLNWSPALQAAEDRERRRRGKGG